MNFRNSGGRIRLARLTAGRPREPAFRGMGCACCEATCSQYPLKASHFQPISLTASRSTTELRRRFESDYLFPTAKRLSIVCFASDSETPGKFLTLARALHGSLNFPARPSNWSCPTSLRRNRNILLESHGYFKKKKINIPRVFLRRGDV